MNSRCDGWSICLEDLSGYLVQADMERAWLVPWDQRGQSLSIPSDHSPMLDGEVALGTSQ